MINIGDKIRVIKSLIFQCSPEFLGKVYTVVDIKSKAIIVEKIGLIPLSCVELVTNETQDINLDWDDYNLCSWEIISNIDYDINGNIIA